MADFWIHFNGALRRRLPYLISIPYFTLKINRKFNEIHNFVKMNMFRAGYKIRRSVCNAHTKSGVKKLILSFFTPP